MTTTIVTHLHADDNHADVLAELITEGATRMRAACGCQSFDVLRADDDSGAFIFVQRWDDPPSHDAAFGERIAGTGHLDKVLAATDRPIEQHNYTTV